MLSKVFSGLGIALLLAAGGALAMSAAGWWPLATATPAFLPHPPQSADPYIWDKRAGDCTECFFDIVILDSNGRCVAIPHFHVRGQRRRDELLAQTPGAVWVWEGALPIGAVRQ